MDQQQYTCPPPMPYKDSLGAIIFIAWLFFLTFVTRMVFAPLLPAIESELHLSHGEAGSLFLMISLGMALGPFVSGVTTNKLLHRGSLVLSNLVAGLSLGAACLADSILTLRLALVCLGMAAGLHIPSAMATITAQVQRSDWGKALSIHQLAPPMSFTLAPLLAALFTPWLSWRQIVLAMGLVSMASAICYWIWIKSGEFPGQMPRLAVIREVMGRRSFWVMAALFAMAMGGTAGVFSMLPLYLFKQKGVSLGLANTVIGFSQVTGFISVLAAGWITDRFGIKQATRLSLTGAGIMTILIGLLGGNWLFVVIFAQPAFLAAFFPGAFAAASRIVRPQLRSVSNAFAPALGILAGGGLLPALIGYLAESYSFSLGIIIAGICILIGAFDRGAFGAGPIQRRRGLLSQALARAEAAAGCPFRPGLTEPHKLRLGVNPIAGFANKLHGWGLGLAITFSLCYFPYRKTPYGKKMGP